MGRLVKFGSWIADALLWLWTAIRLSMDWTGRTTILSDAAGAPGEIVKMLDWLLATPWWVPAACAGFLTASLVALQWRRPAAVSRLASPAAGPAVSVTQGSGSALSIGQTGGQTIGTFINQAEKPAIDELSRTFECNNKDQWVLNSRFKIKSSFVPKRLILNVRDDDLLDVEINMEGTGWFSHSCKQMSAGIWAVGITQPIGPYILKITKGKNRLPEILARFE